MKKFFLLININSWEKERWLYLNKHPHTSVTSLWTEITALKTQASFIACRTLSNENANAGQGRHLKTPSSPVSQMSTHCNHFSNLIHIHALIFMRPQVMGPGEVQLPAATEA